MNNYHIFLIKKEVYNIYKNNEHSLYKLLYNLYKLNKTDLNYGITLYNQLCNTINAKKIHEYLKIINNIEILNNKYIILNNKQKTILIPKPSNITYITNKLDNNIIFILNNYSRYLFICEFNKKEYNWLNTY